ncbi:AAA family ATPase [Kribbella sp. CA-253562]|uniref:AAA family ATPase n=1 Tax=Kribbella sp. CA-253562 TaxID=3239942 RepID=UPI003D950557
MPLVLVTGPSGAGKSTVGAELRRRGHPSYDTDLDGLSRWYLGDREVAPPGPAADDRWYAEHVLRLPLETVRRIAAAHSQELAFVCGTVGNEGEIWDLFDAVVSLSLDEATIRRRLATRAPGSFGSTPDDVRRVLGWAATIDEDNARYGALLVDASGPVEQVAELILGGLRARGLG